MDTVLLLFSLLLFFFSVYIFSREDFLLIRKNVPVEQIFDFSFLGLVFVTLFARITFVLFHFSRIYLNPLIFFLFPYFPGLSLFGGVGGGLIFLCVCTRDKRLPTARIFDIFSLSFLLTLPFWYGIHAILNEISRRNYVSVIDITLCILYIVASIFLIQAFVKNKFPHGIPAVGSVIVIALVSLIQILLTMIFLHSRSISIESILWMLTLFGGVLFLITHRKK